MSAGMLTGMAVMGIYRLATTYIQLREAIRNNDPETWPKAPENLIRDRENLCLLEILILKPRQLTWTVVSGEDQQVTLCVTYDNGYGGLCERKVSAGKFTVLSGAYGILLDETTDNTKGNIQS